jgi:hypothetical protein
MDRSHRSLKVATRVRIPLGVLTVEPPVAAPFVPLIWGFLVSDDHLVVSGSCHAVQPMMGCALRLCPIVPTHRTRIRRLFSARPPVAKGGRWPGCRGVTRSTVSAHGRDRRGRRVGLAAERMASISRDAALNGRVWGRASPSRGSQGRTSPAPPGREYPFTLPRGRPGPTIRTLEMTTVRASWGVACGGSVSPS